jgi:hypothetical protein
MGRFRSKAQHGQLGPATKTAQLAHAEGAV